MNTMPATDDLEVKFFVMDWNVHFLLMLQTQIHISRKPGVDLVHVKMYFRPWNTLCVFLLTTSKSFGFYSIPLKKKSHEVFVKF